MCFRYDTVNIENLDILNITLLSILEALQTESDPVIHKLIISLFGKMIYCWSENSAVTINPKEPVNLPKSPKKDALKRNPLAGFNSFIFDRILPACMNLPLRPGYPLSDGQSLLILAELANLHKTAFLSLGRPYCDFLLKDYFPTIPLPPQVGFEFANAVVQLERKQLKKLLQVGFINVVFL
jgi:exportin-T